MDGEILVIVQNSQLLFHFVQNGTFYDGYDSTIGLVALAQRDVNDPYLHVYFHNYDDITCYNLFTDSFPWTMYVGLQEILDFTFVDYNGDNYVDVFATQNGTKTYMIQVTMAAPTILWTHLHNSFEAKYLEIIHDTHDKPRLIIGDYNRLYLAQVGTDKVLEGTIGQYEQIKYLDVWPKNGFSNETALVFLAGNTFYSYNLSLIFGSQAEFEEEIEIDMNRVLKFIIPGVIVFAFIIAVMVIILQKNPPVSI